MTSTFATYAPATGNLNAVVFDLGSLNTRVGFAGEEAPRIVCPSAVGSFVDGTGETRSITELNALGWSQPEMDVQVLGVTAQTDQEAVARNLMRYGYERLRSKAGEHPLLLSEAAESSAASRRRVAEVMFEDFGVPALCICKAPELAAIAAGKSTALVIDLGGSSSCAATVIDGAMVPGSLQSSKITASAIAKMFCKSLASKVRAAMARIYRPRTLPAPTTDRASPFSSLLTHPCLSLSTIQPTSSSTTHQLSTTH